MARLVSNKVYKVRTSWADKDGDVQNWNSYTLIAPDAELAISFAKVRFGKCEYAESVELVAVLDEAAQPARAVDASPEKPSKNNRSKASRN
jgi:hypothetical protein